MRSHSVRRLVLAAMFLALAWCCPFDGADPAVWQHAAADAPACAAVRVRVRRPAGLAVGAITPVLRSALFSMPQMFPTAVAMAFELATYGLVTGLLYRRLPRTVSMLFAALLAAMAAGRLVWAAATFLLTGSLTLQAFWPVRCSPPGRASCYSWCWCRRCAGAAAGAAHGVNARAPRKPGRARLALPGLFLSRLRIFSCRR